eukprot:m.678611 g.678611  ORF g.678611 m.678611 type:complete len:276 (+) comp22807_c0_seq3:1121-1948(+)
MPIIQEMCRVSSVDEFYSCEFYADTLFPWRQGCNSTSGSSGAPNSDIGHGVVCFNGEAGANNYPLRAGKYSQFEGGIRVNAFVSGGFLPTSVRGTKLDGANGMIHVADWYATFAALAGVDPTDAWAAASNLPPIDSRNVWPLLTGANTTSPRDTILVTKDLLVHKNWKFVRGNTTMIEASWGGVQYPNGSSIANDDWVSGFHYKCGSNGCLFDVVADMTEHKDVIDENPQIVPFLQNLMDTEAATIFSVSHSQDPACKTTAYDKYGGFYGPFKEV